MSLLWSGELGVEVELSDKEARALGFASMWHGFLAPVSGFFPQPSWVWGPEGLAQREKESPNTPCSCLPEA